MKVLLIVDLQNGFCPGGGLAVPEGDRIVPVVNELMASGEFDHIVASRDWHPACHKGFAANHPGKKPFDQIEIGSTTQTLWPVHCVAGTFSAEFHPRLHKELIDQVISKGTDPEVDSLSAFVHNDGIGETALRAHLDRIAAAHSLKREEVELVVCGLALDYCVGLTARDGKRLGYNVSLVVDATRAVNLEPGDDVKMLKELASMGVKLVTSRDLLPAREVGRVVRETPRSLTL